MKIITNNPKIFAFDTSTSEVLFIGFIGSLTYLNVESATKLTKIWLIPCF